MYEGPIYKLYRNILIGSSSIYKDGGARDRGSVLTACVTAQNVKAEFKILKVNFTCAPTLQRQRFKNFSCLLYKILRGIFFRTIDGK